MRKLRTEMHRRMLGNGYCARPVEMDCHFESICESCSFFVTTIEFRPTLQRQRDDAAEQGPTRTPEDLRRHPRPPRHRCILTRPLTADHPHKFNHRRLYEYCGDIPPVELETAYYAQQPETSRRLYEYCGDIPPVDLEAAYYAQHQRPAAG